MYARDHLRSEATDAQRFEETFACPDTGRRWVLNYPDRTEGEMGPARLRAAGKGPGDMPPPSETGW